MKKKKFSIVGVLVIFIILLGVWLAVKGSFLKDVQNFKNGEIASIYNDIKDLEIKTNSYAQNANWQDISIYIPEEFVMSETKESSIWYTLKGETLESSKVNISISNISSVYEDLEKIKDGSFITPKMVEKFEAKNNLNDIVDYMKYFVESKARKGTLFTSFKQIALEHYVDTYLAMITTGSNKNQNYFLTGDLKGYMTLGKQYINVILADENKIYSIEVMSKEENAFTLDEMIKILQSITIV